MIEISIYNIIGLSVVANLIAHWFEPIQGVKGKFIDLFKFNATTHNSLDLALNCGKCMSFWLGLFFFQDIFIAALCSLIGFLINHLIDRVEHWYE